LKVGIVGGGNAGTLFLKTLLEIPEVDVIGVCDNNTEAPAIIFAQEHGIPTYFDLKLFLEKYMDVVLELTGIPEVRSTIEQLKKHETHLMDSHAAKLASLLTEHQQELSEKLADYIDYIKELLMNVTSNLSAINETVLSIDSTSKSILESVSNSIESINTTDQIVKIINQITARIRILGINASIEAARAGEMGKGFSVVASEIGNLTTSSKKATSEIEAIIDKMKADINKLSGIANTLDTICKKQREVASSLADDNAKMSSIISK
jgi:methyl-accepting chemotaxis protein